MIVRTTAAKTRGINAAAVRDKRADLAKRKRMRAAALLKKNRELVKAFTPEQVGTLRKYFDAFDEAKEDFIMADQLGPMLRHLGDDPRPAELQDLTQMVDEDGNGVIDFDEFITLVAIRCQHHHSAEELMAAFKLFDTEDTGKVLLTEFRSIMLELGGMEHQEVDTMLASLLAEDPHVLQHATPAAAPQEVKQAVTTFLTRAVSSVHEDVPGSDHLSEHRRTRRASMFHSALGTLDASFATSGSPASRGRGGGGLPGPDITPVVSAVAEDPDWSPDESKLYVDYRRVVDVIVSY
jgi:Ca2+-binding EF-hand superfamily protein